MTLVLLAQLGATGITSTLLVWAIFSFFVPILAVRGYVSPDTKGEVREEWNGRHQAGRPSAAPLRLPTPPRKLSSGLCALGSGLWALGFKYLVVASTASYYSWNT